MSALPWSDHDGFSALLPVVIRELQLEGVPPGTILKMFGEC
jgi:hypothetical protein